MTTRQQLLDQVSTFGVFVVFALLSLVVYEIAFRAGRWWQARTPDVDEEGVSGVLVGSLLALMAFLLAVTMGMASDRYDTRRQLVIDEANMIETAYLRAGTLPSPASERTRELLREYAPLRVVPDDDAALEAALVRAEEIQDELWTIVEEVTRADSSDVIALFEEAIGDLNVLDDDRIAAGMYSRVPESVMLILLIGSIASIAIVGYNAGLKGHRSAINAAVMIVTLGAVFTLVVDIDRPGDGIVTVTQQPLIDVAQRIQDQDPDPEYDPRSYLPTTRTRWRPAPAVDPRRRSARDHRYPAPPRRTPRDPAADGRWWTSGRRLVEQPPVATGRRHGQEVALVFQTIDGMREGVIAMRGVGRVTGDDYRTVLDPAVERATAGGRKARLYLELGEGFEGYDASAMLADTSVGMGHWRSFERVAVVTDTDWIRHAIHLFGPLIPGDVRVFAVSETDAARAWVAS